jgi:fructose-1,6-bisphosphatase/inositol monophosphatase family enzyme
MMVSSSGRAGTRGSTAYDKAHVAAGRVFLLWQRRAALTVVRAGCPTLKRLSKALVFRERVGTPTPDHSGGRNGGSEHGTHGV